MKSGEQRRETSAPTPEVSTTNTERRALLGPQLGSLLGLASGLAAGEELSDSISLEGAPVELNAWERRVLSRNPGGIDREGRTWPGLIFEGVALRARCGGRIAGLETGRNLESPEQRAGLVGALKLDVAIGVALKQELQRAVEELIRANEFRIVKPVTDFRNALGVQLAEMRRQLGNEGFAEAERLATSFLDPARPAPPAVNSDHSLETAAPVRFKRDPVAAGRIVSRKKAGPNRRMPVLLALLALSSAGWVAFHVATRSDYVPPPVLTMDEFRDIEMVRAVMARPPSLYIDLDAESWGKLRPSQRRDLLDDIGSVAAGSGYVGVHVRTTSGFPAGQWMKHGGSRVAEPSPRGT